MLTSSLTAAKAAIAPLMLNSKGIQQWVIDNIVFLMLIFVGMIALAAVKKKDVAGTLTMAVVVLLALSFIVTPDLWVSFGKGLANVAIG